MSVRPTTNRSLRRLALAGSIIASLTFTGVASAGEPTVTQVDGNPTCSSVVAGGQGSKIDPVPQGHHSFRDGTIDVSGLYFDWTAPAGVDAVIVKGGPTANVYRSDDELTSGTGLHAPINPDNGQPYGLSHLEVCTDGRDETPAAPAEAPAAPAETPAPATETTPAQSEVLTEHASGKGKPERKSVPARARLKGPRHCVKGPFRVSVRGKGIKAVKFRVDGRKVGGNRNSVRVNPSDSATGVMRVTAKVVFVKAAHRRAATLRMTVLRCAAPQSAASPHFAG